VLFKLFIIVLLLFLISGIADDGELIFCNDLPALNNDKTPPANNRININPIPKKTVFYLAAFELQLLNYWTVAMFE